MRADTVDETPRWRPSEETGRSFLLGLGLAATAVVLAAVLAHASQPGDDTPEAYTDYEDPYAAPPKPRSKVLGVVWPPMLLALTLSGLKIWRSPQSRRRTQALTLWGMAQMLNTAWMALGPRRLGGKLATAVASMGATGAYVLRSRGVDRGPGPSAGPPTGWAGVATALGGDPRKPGSSTTVH